MARRVEEVRPVFRSKLFLYAHDLHGTLKMLLFVKHSKHERVQRGLSVD
jgi:hypothetical protein